MNDKYIKNVQQCDLHTFWCEKIESNVELKFCCEIKKQENVVAQWIAKDFYNLFINGKFVAYGPARAAKGYARLETMDFDEYLTEDNNIIEIYVQSNHTNLLCHTKESPYLGICIKADDKVIKQTEDFRCYRMQDKLQKVERMSSQRGFLEVYNTEPNRKVTDELQLVPVECPKILKRNVSYAKNIEEQAVPYRSGFAIVDKNKVWENDLTKLLDDGLKMGGYPRKDCECVLSKELLQFVQVKDTQHTDNEHTEKLDYYIYKLPKVYCGKFKLVLKADNVTNLWVTYDDLLVDDFVMFNREQNIHGMKWTLEAGEYTLYSQEVYSAQYIQMVCDGPLNIESVSMIRIENPLNNLNEHVANLATNENMDEDLKKIVQAAKNTYAQNAYDLYTDCPSRERAGWLCDSYFLGKAERFFQGQNTIEKNFLENYFLYENEVFAHKGIMPMCYPAHLGKDDYIPNWILWYVLELEDYLKRTDDSQFVELHHERIRDILDFFKNCENEEGLLEHLEGWVFVEWSEASDYVEGVNFPTNILYAAALEAAGNLLKDTSLNEKSLKLKKLIREMSYDGEFYIDNAIRVNGKLEHTENRSELCQIFAAYFDIEPNDKDFYERFVAGYKNIDTEKYIAPAALFIGGILRLMVLYKLEKYEQVLIECKERFLGMTEKTGTTWEFFEENASCNHGFGSIIGKIICESADKLN